MQQWRRLHRTTRWYGHGTFLESAKHKFYYINESIGFELQANAFNENVNLMRRLQSIESKIENIEKTEFGLMHSNILTKMQMQRSVSAIGEEWKSDWQICISMVHSVDGYRTVQSLVDKMKYTTAALERFDVDMETIIKQNTSLHEHRATSTAESQHNLLDKYAYTSAPLPSFRPRTHSLTQQTNILIAAYSYVAVDNRSTN